MGLSADQFPAFLDAHDLFNLRERSEGLERVMGSFVSDGRDDSLLGAKDRSWIIPEALDLGDDFVDLSARSLGLNDNDHK